MTRSALSSRWTVGAAAWAGFAAAAWFAGDALSLAGWRPLDAPAARLALIAGAAVAWLGWELVRMRRAVQANERLLSGLAAGADPDSAQRAQHELQLLRGRFEEALAVLRKARFRGPDGERRLVGDLPWYIFIGAPGSGKTTALLNAGLRFPLGDPRAGHTVQGVGGTRNCDWYFTDEAVLLDTAGRYTTQDSDSEADAAAWLGFLALLKQSRPRQPLNGAIVTLSVSDLVHWTPDELQRYAAHVKERLWELHTRLGVRLPVYLLVTKSDLLAGFSEFFSEYDAAARGQVWGVTFPHSELGAGTRIAARFQEEFGRLERRLYSVLPSRLQDERDLQRRAAIYRFPQQFRGLLPMLASFLDDAFGSGWVEEQPFVRGLYFTSGTQEGSPIDRVLGTLARTFNLERKVQPPNVGSGKSFFLRRLLRDVIFAESGLAGADPARERARIRAQRLAMAGVAGLAGAAAVAWSAAYLANRSFVDEAHASAAQAAKRLDGLASMHPGAESRLLQALDDLHGLARREASAVQRLAFDQTPKIGGQAERAYRSLLHGTLVPWVETSPKGWKPAPENAARLQAHLRAAQAEGSAR